MPTLERAIKRYSDKHPHMQAYAKCQSRAFMMGTVTFVTSAAVVYVFQELLGSKLPYSRKAILFPPIILGTLAAYTMTRHQTMICQQMWMAIEEKHSVITPISERLDTANTIDAS